MSTKIQSERPYGDVPTVPDASELSIDDLASGGTSPIEIEIGFGKGHFLLDRAEGCPDVRLIGIETRRKWVHLVETRAVRRGLSNVKVWFGDVRRVIPRIMEGACLSRLFVNFPDPWWKARHEKRMVVTPELACQSARLLEDGGELFVQTDVDFRAEVYFDVLSSNKDFKPLNADKFVDENPFGARSLREKKCEEVGLPIYRMLFRRVSRPDSAD